MTEAFRLTLELGEETRARWQAAAVRIGYERLDVWAYDTLDASADPEAGQVVGVETMGGPERVELRARLTTAGQERDEARHHGREAVKLYDDRGLILRDAQLRRDQADNEARGLRARLRAAEARVEAAERERDEWLREAGKEALRAQNGDIRLRACHGDREQFRVRAGIAEEALREIAERFGFTSAKDEAEWMRARARAALACPPQQRGE